MCPGCRQMERSVATTVVWLGSWAPPTDDTVERAMGLIRAAFGAVGGTLADQWVDFITAPQFDEQTLVAPGIVQQRNAGRGSNTQGSASIISDGSRITVPENTALI